LLDTNAVIAVLNEPAGLVSQRLRRYLPADILMREKNHVRPVAKATEFVIVAAGYLLGG